MGKPRLDQFSDLTNGGFKRPQLIDFRSESGFGQTMTIEQTSGHEDVNQTLVNSLTTCSGRHGREGLILTVSTTPP